MPTIRSEPEATSRRTGPDAALLLAGLAFLSLGLSTRDEDEIPETDLVVSAEIIDISQTKTTGERVSIDGATYFSVLRGRMTIFVPFDKLKSVESTGEIRNDDGVDRVEASFTFLDGSIETGLLKARQVLYGVSKFGNFQLKLRDLRSIRFLDIRRKEPTPKPS